MPQMIWSVVPEIEAERIKNVEIADGIWEKPMWTCAHCTTFGEKFQTRRAIIEHVKAEYVYDCIHH